MITVEANVKDTIHEKILPREQDLIPVSLKRKFEYKGNYMEEMTSKRKIEEYFNYFKRENPLFANEQLNPDRIDEWIKSVSGEDCETEEVDKDCESDSETEKVDKDCESDSETEEVDKDCESDIFEGTELFASWNLEDFETEKVDAGTAQCEDCEKQQVHICQVDSYVYDSYWKLDSGEVPLLEKYDKKIWISILD